MKKILSLRVIATDWSDSDLIVNARNIKDEVLVMVDDWMYTHNYSGTPWSFNCSVGTDIEIDIFGEHDVSPELIERFCQEVGGSVNEIINRVLSAYSVRNYKFHLRLNTGETIRPNYTSVLYYSLLDVSPMFSNSERLNQSHPVIAILNDLLKEEDPHYNGVGYPDGYHRWSCGIPDGPRYLSLVYKVKSPNSNNESSMILLRKIFTEVGFTSDDYSLMDSPGSDPNTIVITFFTSEAEYKFIQHYGTTTLKEYELTPDQKELLHRMVGTVLEEYFHDSNDIRYSLDINPTSIIFNLYDGIIPRGLPRNNYQQFITRVLALQLKHIIKE